MTRAEKCDCCRQRKVKCDERHPICGPCAKAGRECKYTYGRVSGFVNYQHETSTTSEAPPPSSSSSRKSRSHDDSKHGSGSGSGSGSRGGRKGKAADEDVVLSLRSSKSTQSGSSSGLMQTFNLVPASRKPSASGGKSSGGKGGGSSSSSSSKKPARRSDSKRTSGPSVTTGAAETWEDPTADWDPHSNIIEEEGSSLFLDWLAFLGDAGGSFSSQESALYCLGDWVDSVAQYVGQNGVVDAAVTAVLCGAAAFRERTEENVVMARESNMNALRVLRLSLSEDRQTADSRGALVATKLLDLSELLINPETYHRQYHVRGLIDILRRLYSQSQAYDETIQTIYYSHFFAETMRAMYRGEPSAFERTSWYDMDPPILDTADSRWPGYTFALKTVMQAFVRLPRLVCVTRQASRHHHHHHHRDSHGLRAGAAHLALELFEGSNLDGWIGGLLDTGAVRVVPTTDPDAQVLTPHSYRFASPRLYQLLVTYWTSRLVLCGCCCPGSGVAGEGGGGGGGGELDPLDVQEADLRAANSVAMCVDYGLQLDPSLPCAQMMQLGPLRTAFGAWHRLAGRDGLRGAAGAGDMMAWCLALINNMEASLSLRLSSEEELVRRASCLAAGPVYENGS